MNRRAAYFGMSRTHYENPHGLSDKANYSTCSDIVKLCSQALQNRQFVQTVTTKEYCCLCPITGKEYKWVNTHKLLDEGWHGIKTGVTPAAGPCLASYYKHTPDRKPTGVMIILLGCDTMDLRYEETKLLLKHSLEHKTIN